MVVVAIVLRHALVGAVGPHRLEVEQQIPGSNLVAKSVDFVRGEVGIVFCNSTVVVCNLSHTGIVEIVAVESEERGRDVACKHHIDIRT